MTYNTGDILGDYLLLSRCGSGAYGTVFLAENRITRHQVALKIVYRHGRSFERELKGLQQYQTICRRTNLLQIYHVGQGDGFFYYTMDAADPLAGDEYVPATLANILQERGKLAPNEVKKMAEELISALKTLHLKGVLHRDIKPENILWVEGQAIPGDIGLVTDNPQTVLAGTPGFVPSEVLAGSREPEEKDDFYALGKVIYCALTGNPVNRFPEFPAGNTLTGAGEMIKLYHRLCAGEKFEPPLKSGKRRLKWYILGVAALLLPVAGIFYLIPESPRVTADVPEQTTPEIPAYQPSRAMLDLLPQLRKHYQQLETQMNKAMSEASKNISDQEIAEAERYLAQHPEDPLCGYPQAWIMSQKDKQAEKEFDRQHQNDPVWCYFRNQQEIAFFTASLKGNTFPQYPAAQAQSKLRELYRRQGELETAILKKYQK